MTKEPILTAVAGIGGFGAAHHSALEQLEKEGRIKVIATCDPREADLASCKEEYHFSERGIAVYDNFEAMIAAHGATLGLVTVAAPIGFHAPMHRACVELGIPCYLEKPPTLDPDELDAMIATDAKAPFKTQVGFNYIYQPERIALKKRILSGEFGALKRVVSDALWPRNVGYYRRNNWAGRLLLGDYILLDSCCGNAISHHLQNILYFGGTSDLASVARPTSVEAELYRANEIEGTDTVFARGVLDSGVEFRIGNSHASDIEGHLTVEWYICEKAEICLTIKEEIAIRYTDGREEKINIGQPSLYGNFALYLDYLGGKETRPVTLLENCRGFVELNALLYVAAGAITTVEPPDRRTAIVEGQTFHQIIGMAQAVRELTREGIFPSESHRPWGRQGGNTTINSLGTLRSTLETMRALGEKEKC